MKEIYMDYLKNNSDDYDEYYGEDILDKMSPDDIVDIISMEVIY